MGKNTAHVALFDMESKDVLDSLLLTQEQLDLLTWLQEKEYLDNGLVFFVLPDQAHTI